MPFIGQLSLAMDMKTALTRSRRRGGRGSMPVCPDAKGHEIISPEEKAKLEGKAHETATEVRLHHNHGAAAVDWTASCAAAQEERV